MGQSLQQGQMLSTEEKENEGVVDVAAATPAMQALIAASTAASEAQTTEHSSEAPQESVRENEAPSTLASPATLVDSNPTNRGNPTLGVISPMNESGLANLDPNDHARVSDPIARPAKRTNKYGKRKGKFIGNSSNDHTNGDDADDDSDSSGHDNANEDTSKTPVDFSESILSRLFEPDRKQKPKLWEFIRLVAPGPANQPPEGQYKWRSKDAVAAYCLKCKTAFTYTPGTSKTVSRHLIAHHGYPNPNLPPTSSKNSKSKKSFGRNNAKLLTPNTPKDLPESGGNSATARSVAKDSLSIVKRKRRQPVKIAPASTFIGREENIINHLSSPKKRKVDCLETAQVSSKKGRKNSDVSKGWKRQEESPEINARRDKEAMNLLTTDDEDGEDAFLKGHGRNRKAVIEKALFRWWVASYQSLDFHDGRGDTRDIFCERNKSLSLFRDFCKTLDDSFELPTPLVMDTLAQTSYERLQTEIRIHVSQLFPGDTEENSNKSHEFVSASVRKLKVVRIVNKGDARDCNASHVGATGNWGHQLLGEGKLEIEEKILYPVRLTFCTPMFRMKSYVIAVIPGGEEWERRHGDRSEGNATKTSPYSKAVDFALRMYGFPRDNVSRIVIRGSCNHVEELGRASIELDEGVCILDRLDGIFAKALRHSTSLPKRILKLFGKKKLQGEEEIEGVQKPMSCSMFFTIRAYDILLASLPSDEMMETIEHKCFANMLDTITPFRDAIYTLSADSYSTIGLSIPVLRRVNIVLHKRAKSLEEQQNDASQNLEDVDDHEANEFKEALKFFQRSMLEVFEKTFAPELAENPNLMWTVPLDPRLIAMRGLSEMEQSKAKSMLIKEVATIVQIINRRELDQNKKPASDLSLSKINRNRYSSASTMDGIFWGDDLGPTTDNATDVNVVSSAVENAEQYAKNNVDTYFNAVHSQRQIKDPLLWWKNNQEQFPELAMLARKWISASAVYGRKSTRENESESVITTSHFKTESICRMIFLHDNNDLV